MCILKYPIYACLRWPFLRRSWCAQCEMETTFVNKFLSSEHWTHMTVSALTEENRRKRSCFCCTTTFSLVDGQGEWFCFFHVSHLLWGLLALLLLCLLQPYVTLHILPTSDETTLCITLFIYPKPVDGNAPNSYLLFFLKFALTSLDN